LTAAASGCNSWPAAAPIDLNKQFTAIRDELADLRRRAETAAKTDRNQP
jgi:hypothetical protein